MAAIRDSDGNQQILQPEHVVGRAPGCALRLDERYVSAQHAALRWTGDGWELRDLGSRNGTFFNGVRLVPGSVQSLHEGDRLAFGKRENEWKLVDDAPATVMVVELHGGPPVLMEGELLALPSSDDPLATLYRDSEGRWLVEFQDEATTEITDQQTFEVAGVSYRFCCPESICKTSLAGSDLVGAEPDISQLRLTFSVSSDEEHVQLQAQWGGMAYDLGSRAHLYLLLTLARRRLEDAAAGLPETSCGWVYQEDFAHDRSMHGQQLNVDVFRIRKQFASLPIPDAARIVERRPRTRQLRVGTGQLSVVKL